MVIVGLNLGSTEFNKKLHDGGICIVVDGKVKFAVAEERISRRKRSGGFRESLDYALSCLNLDRSNIDLVVYSSCCESINNSINIAELQNIKSIPCDHHLSHALSVYLTSPYEKALIAVLDAGGNLLGNDNHSDWWLHSREQQSYYVAEGNNVTLIDRDFILPEAAGIGEIYRAFTYYLGWESSRFAGKTMALAAYGDPGAFKGNNIFDLDINGNIRSHIKNNPIEPLSMVEQLLDRYGRKNVPPRKDGQPILQVHSDLARWIQNETEDIVTAKLNYLMRKTGISNLCLAGGVAYNCSMVGKIMNNTMANNVFLQPASGDQGQCLGNAMFGYTQIRNAWIRVNPFNPYLGCGIEINHDTIRGALKSNNQVTINAPRDIAVTTAKLLSQGEIVAWFQDRSEFGPRALGNRSILANPCLSKSKEKLNSIKGREDFMPFAPTVLYESAKDYFVISDECPFMTAAVKVRPNVRETIPAAVHVDGTSRVQTLRKENNPLFYDLIHEFYKLTKVPLIINTSFNAAGEPIVETLNNAIDTFMKLDIRFMVAGSFLLEKPLVRTSMPSVKDAGRLLDIVFGADLIVNETELSALLSERFPGIKSFPRDKFLLNEKFINWLKNGRKTTTIRYKKVGIDFPVATCLPLIPTKDFSKNRGEAPVGFLKIRKYIIKKYRDLNETDARNDGFKTLTELRSVLFDIYGAIQEDDYVSIYYVQIKNNPS